MGINLNKQLCLILLMLLASLTCIADVDDGTVTEDVLDPAEVGYDFIVDGIYYKKLGGDSVSTSAGELPYVGKVVIPDVVEYEGDSYRITKVSGFGKSPDVTEVTIPKYTKVISAFYGREASLNGGPGIKIKSETTTDDDDEDPTISTVFSKLEKVYFNADNCESAYYSVHTSTMLGGGYDGYLSVFPFSLQSIEFGENVERIPNGLLYGCSEIKEIVFPESVRYIGWLIINPDKDNIEKCELRCADLQEIAWLPKNRDCVELGSEFHTYPCGKEHYLQQSLPNEKVDAARYSNMFHDFIGLELDAEGMLNLPIWVQNIAPNAFSGYESNFKLELPATMTEISANAFENCDQLEEITIPARVQRIGKEAFKGCSNLKTLYFNAENCAEVGYPYPFAECTSLNNVIFGENVKRIPRSVLTNCKALEWVSIPDSVAEIGGYAFHGTGLREVTIPNSVTTIGGYAFGECEKLTTVYCNARNCNVEYGAFRDCASLNYVEFGEGVEEIPGELFKDCSNLKQVKISNTVNKIDYSAFNGTGLTELVLPCSVTSIGDAAFYGCSKLQTVYFNPTNCNVGYNVFGDCESLNYVEFGETVKTIPEGIFRSCLGLKQIKISDSVTEIGDIAFIETGLEDVTIPRAVTKIGYRAFKDCYNLKTVYFNAENCTVDYSFFSCGLEEVKFGDNVKKISSHFASQCNNLTELIIPESVTVIGGGAFNSCSNLKMLYFNARNCEAVADESGEYRLHIPSSLSNVIFGEEVRKIPDYLLYNCREITQIEIPEMVEEIGAYAFSETPLTLIVIPNNVKKIGNGAFYECWNLTSVTIGSSVTEIGSEAFYIFGCNYIKNVTSLNQTPPNMPDDAFFNHIYSGATLTVQSGALQAYQEANAWKNFAKISEADLTGVEDVKLSEDIPFVYYNLQGVEVDNPQKGIYIRKQGNKVTKVAL